MKTGLIKKLINSDFSDNKLTDIFSLLKTEFNYDEAYIVFFNPNSITIKYTYPHNLESIGKIIEFDENYMEELFSQDNENFEKLTKALFLKSGYSFLTSKLTLKNTIFGAVIIATNNKITSKDKDLLDTISSILAYKIKDKELSEIFKIQLSTIQENFIESKNNYKSIQAQNAKILELDKIKS